MRLHHPSELVLYLLFPNVYHYPNLFDLNLLNQIGFYASRGKSGRWNPNGLSRDHRVSVSEAIENNYDEKYISHPLNCQLMPHSENNKKKSNSSISYEMLVKLVDEYEMSKVERPGVEPGQSYLCAADLQSAKLANAQPFHF